MNAVVNDGTRKGGYSCSQWVLGKFPRRYHDLISGENSISQVSEKLNPDSEFQDRIEMRAACKKAFAKTDCSRRVARCILRKAAPVTMQYAVGDLISFKRKQGSKNRVDRLWSSPTRLIGFDGEKTAWGLCEGVPVCVAIDKIRPCSAEESLAYLYLNKNLSLIHI